MKKNLSSSKRFAGFLALVLVVGLVPGFFAAAHAATTIVVDDDGQGEAGNCDAVTPAESSIGAAVVLAAPGDTIQVCPGTYAENITLNKSLTLQGAQAGVDARTRPGTGESVVAPGSGAGLTLAGGSAGSTIDGFSFAGAGRGIESATGPIDGVSIVNNRFTVGSGQNGIFLNDPGVDVTVDQNLLDGGNVSSTLVHLDTDNFNGFRLTNNDILNSNGTGFFSDGNHNVNPSGLRPPAITGNRFENNTTGANLGSRSWGFATISGNNFRDNDFPGLQGGIQNSLISGNTFDGNGRGALELTSFGSAAVDRGAQNNLISGNLFTGNGFGAGNVAPNTGEAIFLSATQAPGTISTNQFHFNRIVGNKDGFVYVGAETIDAENNWWGCNAGPGNAGCDSAPAAVDSNPWLVLTVTTSNASVPAGSTATITADLTINSDAVDTSPDSVPDGTPVSFDTDKGSIAPTSTSTTDGVATATLSHGASNGPANPSATVDNETQSTSVFLGTEGTGGAGGGTFTTDPGTNQPTPTDNTTTTVQTKGPGPVSIYEDDTHTLSAPAGYAFLGQEVNITAPDATPADPLVITFKLDASIVGGIDPSMVAVRRNGVFVPNCAAGNGTTANPDPCVESRSLDGNGDLVIVVYTSQASIWDFLEPVPICTITGTPGDDFLVGTNGPDVICGLGGNDTIVGKGGGDELHGQGGNDTLYGKDGNDDMFGGAGDDDFFGGTGGDEMYGGLGNDRMWGGLGDEQMYGGFGDDLMVGRFGSDYLEGSEGHDTMIGGDGNDTFDAGEGNNDVYAGIGSDFILAGSGNDRLRGGGGSDFISAGDGNNEILAGDGDNIVTSGTGNDYVDAGLGSDSISTGGGDDDVFAGHGTNNIDVGDGNNHVLSGTGPDTVTSGTGNDVIETGLGDDVVNSGGGNDDILLGDGANFVNAGDGNNYVLGGPGVDNIITGTGNDRIDAEGGNNLINVGDGDNAVFAGNGNNLVTSGSGADFISLGLGADTIFAGGGPDVVYAGRGTNDINGEAGDDYLVGGEDNDDFDGGANADTCDAGSLGFDTQVNCEVLIGTFP